MKSQEKWISPDGQLHSSLRRVLENLKQVIIGKERVIEHCIVALLCNGHVLLEDAPGVGKTTLVKALSRSLGLSFRRIQFTPDLLPSDVTGVSIYNQQSGQFEFRSGPIMGNLLLADEINRTSPKTQSALLEAMEEGHVTVDGISHRLPIPFFVIATQNAIEYEGTYPLPEAQLDRFFVKLRLGYPRPQDELEMLNRMQKMEHPIEQLEEVLSQEELLQLQREVRDVFVDESLKRYVVEITSQTRHHPSLYLGASPRGSLALFRAAQGLSFLKGRDFVIPDDVKEMAVQTLAHRLILKSDAQYGGETAEGILRSILQQVSVPVFSRDRH